MSDHSENEQEILSRWLSGELSNSEAKEQLGEEQFSHYAQILNEVDHWRPDLDEQIFDPSVVFSQKKEAKVRSLNTWQVVSIAASLLLFIGLGYFFMAPGENSYAADLGEVLTIDLPDGQSTVTLGPGSSIRWEGERWTDQERLVSLSGKAYFDIEPGGPLGVMTENGKVEVLGTRFDVSQFESSLSVHCYEGKVRATGRNNQSVVLNGGEKSLYHGDAWEEVETNPDEEPTWMEGEIKFKNAPISQVINEIKTVYNLKIIPGNVNLQRRFTGAIPTDNLKLTLVIVFDTLEIDYQLDGNELTLSE